MSESRGPDDAVLAEIRALREQGASTGEIRERLMASGHGEAQARKLMSTALAGMSAARSRAPVASGRGGDEREGGGGGGMRILGTIGFVLVLNGLSYVFDWGWYFW